MKIVLPEDVTEIIETLEQSGYEAYAVGGCVRDSILGKTPSDWDITTSATPSEMKRLFPRTVDTGIEHGTVTVLKKGRGYEVTTYRIDGEYRDARHPSEVTFTSSLAEDLRRRDFTINAMAYNETGGLVDLFGGTEDLDQGVVRCVGDPRQRFSEDALRMLRALRFSAQLDFAIEENTLNAVTELAATIEKVSAERIRVELEKILVSDRPGHMRLVYFTCLSRYILPELDVMMASEQNNKHHCYTVGEHTMEALEYSPKDRVIRLAVLLHDVAKPLTKTTDERGIDHFHGHQEKGEEMAKAILRRLKYDNETIAKVAVLVRFHDERPKNDIRSVRRAVVRMGERAFPELFDLKRADVMAQSTYRRQEKLQAIDDFERLYGEINEKRQCLAIRDLAVSGRDMIDLGISPGPAIGQMLQRLLSDVVESPEHNTKEYLTDLAADLWRRNAPLR